MKKLMIAAALAASAMFASAASLDWKYTSRDAGDTGATFYLCVGSTAPEKFASVEAVLAASVSHLALEWDTDSEKAIASATASSASIVKPATDFYGVLVSADGKSYQISSVKTVSNDIEPNYYMYIYEPDNKESPDKMFTAITPSTMGESQSFGAVPEPTSGLLLLLGVAGLALKRRRA